MTDDAALLTTVRRLSRPHASGGRVIERAAVLAAGAEAPAILRWISEHGQPEALALRAADQGIHGARDSAGPDARKPLRYVVSAAALVPPEPEPEA